MIRFDIEAARRWPRPLMAWVTVPLIPVAVLYPGVGSEKLALILGFAAALYGLRAWERRGNADAPQ